MPNHTILLIDYEPRSIERFRQPLTDAGYTVEVATDGLTGIEAFHRLSPDMVLVEAMIPKKHGFEVCQELKRTPHGRRTPVLITTGVYKGRKYRTQALHIYGCDEYIEKPIAPEQLLAVVGKFFGSAASTASAAAPEARIAAPAEPAVVTVTATDGARHAHAQASVSHEPPPRPSAPKPSASSVAKDFTEEEIMARLDAILPGGDFPRADADAPLRTVAVEPEPIAAVPTAAPPATRNEHDPFAQMQAELTAELGSLSAALALEPAPVFDSMPQAVPSDQVLAPSVLEALPLPELETTPIPTTPEATTVASESATESTPIEQPGQLVNFDAKRTRRKKQGKKSRESAAAPSIPDPPAEPPAAETPRPESLGATVAAETLSLPVGTLVESDLAGAQVKKGVPVWIWAAIAVIGLIAVYFAFLRGGPAGTDVSQEQPRDEGVASVETDSGASGNAAATEDNANLVLNSITPLPPRGMAPPPAPKSGPIVTKPSAIDPPPDRLEPAQPTTAPSTSAGTGAVATSPITTPSVPVTPPAEAPTLSDPLTASLGDTDDSVAGVETIPETPVAAAPSIAPGTLVDAEEIDTAPVSLSRKAPLYSLQARQMRLQGTVVMKVLVNDRGTVDEVVIVSGVPGADLNNSAIRAAKSWTYRPATKGGVPVKTWKVEQVAFKM